MISFLIPEKDLPYNPNDLSSVLEYTKKLEGNTLRKLTKGNLDSAKKNKGGIGQLTEELYFFLKNNSSPVARSTFGWADKPPEGTHDAFFSVSKVNGCN